MSFPLLKTTLKKNLMIGIIFFLVMLMYSAVMISMFSPDSIAALNAMFKVLPPDMMKALGFATVFTDFLGYLASWLYGLILTAFPMVYCIILGNRLVAKTVDSTSITCLLTTPNSRTKIIVTKGIYALGSMAVLQILIYAVNLLLTKVMFPNEIMDNMLFLKLNVTVMLVNMTAMAITFFFSCLFNNTALSYGFGAGIPIAFLVFNMVGNASEKATVLKNFSIYGWYDPVKIATGEPVLSVNLIYIGVIVALFEASVLVFKRKRLPI